MARLGFGYNQGLPKGTLKAWGARMIVDQTGYTDLVPGRTDWIGEPGETDELQDWLNGGVLRQARETASDLLKGYEMKTREAGAFVLYEEEQGIVKGNTNASAGYLYLCAYLKADVDPSQVDVVAEAFDGLAASYAERVATALDLIGKGHPAPKVFAEARLTMEDAAKIVAIVDGSEAA